MSSRPQARYAHYFEIGHNEFEFIFDFGHSAIVCGRNGQEVPPGAGSSFGSPAPELSERQIPARSMKGIQR
jgi:hypothetical protein